MAVKKFWNWKILNSKDEDNQDIQERNLYLNGAIAEESWFDDDITPAIFKEELNSGTGAITVWINSPGGDCIAASQIYTMLMEYKGKVTVKIDGIAASAASVIAMAGETVLMSPTGLMMIHNPLTLAFGDASEMQKAIEVLDAVKESIINAYEIKTGLSRSKISKLMDSETWMDASKATELGFVDGMLSRESQTTNKTDSYAYSAKVSQMQLENKLKTNFKPQAKRQGRKVEDLITKLNQQKIKEEVK